MKVSKRFSSFAVKSDYVSVPTATAGRRDKEVAAEVFTAATDIFLKKLTYFSRLYRPDFRRWASRPGSLSLRQIP